MAKTKQELITIASLAELRPSLRKKVRTTGIGIGLLVAWITFVLLSVLGFYPESKLPLEFVRTQWLILVAFACSSGVIGFWLGLYFQLADLGYRLKTLALSFEHQPSSGFSTHESSSLRPYSFSSSMSINPASGLPMSGSSGMDIRGNPSGSNSW